MKAQRRHELQTNALADWLSKTIEQIKPHVNTILIGAVLVVGAAAAVMYLAGRSDQRAAQAWNAFYQARAVEDVEQRISELVGVAEQHADTAPGLWARLMAGEARLQRGASKYIVDHSEGEEDLDKAQLDFQTVIKEAESLSQSQRELLLQRAHWGLAQTFDTLAKGEQALDQYQKLAQSWPDSALGKAAADKVENLKDMQDWYQWYAKAIPSEIEPTATEDRLPPGMGHGGTPPGVGGGFAPRQPAEDSSGESGFDLPDPLSVPGAGDLTPGIDGGDDPAGDLDLGGDLGFDLDDEGATSDGATTDGAPTVDIPAGDETPFPGAATPSDGAADEGAADDGGDDAPQNGSGEPAPTDDAEAPSGSAADEAETPAANTGAPVAESEAQPE